ncbi:MAG: DegQ family serine endoprotease [Alphaproteobacteria bacterium]
MRSATRLVFAVTLTAISALGWQQAQALSVFPKKEVTKVVAETPESFADVVEKLLPAVVNISSTMKAEELPPEMMPELPMPQFPEGSPLEDFFQEFMERRGQMGEEQMIPQASLGSGFVIDAEKGYIVTNNHVVKDADEVRVTFHDDQTLPAEVVGRDEKIDLALIKVTGKKNLTAVKFGNSDVLRVGDWVVAIGNPFGLGGTVTAGIVSARQRDINSGPYDDFIQTDASINRGNSGGPMFNTQGEVIGINTAIFSPSGGSVGIGFAIPSALASPVVRQLVEFGYTRRGWLGVRIQNVTDEIAESLSLPDMHGALVSSVTPKGPAAAAGLQPGDVITEFGGQKLNAMRNLPRIVAETAIDAEVELTYWRNGKVAKAKVKVGELEKAEEEGLLETAGTAPVSEGVGVESMGVTVQAVSNMNRQTYGLTPEVAGVVITKVTPGSEAAEKGLLEGDVIVEINQQPAADPAKVQELLDAAVKSGRNSVLLLINRQGDIRFVAVRLKTPETSVLKEESKEKAKTTEKLKAEKPKVE